METMYTLEEVADQMKVSMSWLYRKAKAGVLPHIRIGGVIRVKESELERWINSQSIKGCQKV